MISGMPSSVASNSTTSEPTPSVASMAIPACVGSPDSDRCDRAEADDADQQRGRDQPDHEPAAEIQQRDDDERQRLVVEAGEEVGDRQFAAAIEGPRADQDAGAQHGVEQRRGDLSEERDEREPEHDGDEQQRENDPDRRCCAEQPPPGSPPFEPLARGHRPAPARGRIRAGGRHGYGRRGRREVVHGGAGVGVVAITLRYHAATCSGIASPRCACRVRGRNDVFAAGCRRAGRAARRAAAAGVSASPCGFRGR